MSRADSPLPQVHGAPSARVSLVESVLGFCRLLRGAGVAIAPDQVEQALRALELVGVANRAQTRAVLAATLVNREQDRALFDQAFALYFRNNSTAATRQTASDRTEGAEGTRNQVSVEVLPPDVASSERADGPHADEEAAPDRAGAWSAVESLAQRDFATLSEEELRTVERLLAQRRIQMPRRRSRRQLRASSGATDMRRTALDAMRRAGEASHMRYRRRKEQPRRIILLCDVSGSMARYARVLLQLATAFVRQGTGAVEVFALETRLTYLTRALQSVAIDRNPLRASWGGGTRLGASLRDLNRHWARRVVRGNALVVILSDGCDRGDTDLLAREMRRLKQRRARIIWVNPLLGDPDYEPLTAGMQAALPHVDHFVAGHNLMRVEALIDLICAQ